ncbi:subtype B tannase [Acinetobacter sp. ANC 4173]|uniref:subtype B tannase n=1 Tax=Acinetobacter sp. ANC 4173 TaxID=2529837 RepID=UPI00103D17A3|nr:subtype B tannase [Acinetobacter sp. ANC 4173]TCB73328.1 alpha/beta hydrolase [Acinetobacter sp. ANC 4173]
MMKKFKIKPLILGIFSIAFSSATLLHAETQLISLKFDQKNFTVKTINVNGSTLKVYAYEGITYVANPVDKKYQSINIYIPEAYFEGQSINGYNAQNAPIFLPNQVGGYMPAEPGTLEGRRPPIMQKNNAAEMPKANPPEGNALDLSKNQQRPNTIASALAHGYVVASPGARGRTLQNTQGQYIGKAPAAIVDLKAAVRYLKLNDSMMPGDANKIISNGTSAGGALSALLGATGDAKDYEPYLKQLGAARTSDTIFATSAYAAITNLEHADAAYEWQLADVHQYKKIDISMLDYKIQRKEQAGTLTVDQIQVSQDLQQQFPVYLNTLRLKDKQGQSLQLDANGEGSFKDYIKSLLIQSAQTALDQGGDLSSLKWLKIENKKIVDIDYDAYLQYLGRQKLPPAFDALDLSSGENDEFGTASIPAQHFTAYSMNHRTQTNRTMADPKIIAMMNPMHYIASHQASTAKHWRIRQGTLDKDTSFAIPAILVTTLANQGNSVDFSLAWNQPHGGDYDLNELFKWIDQIAHQSMK